jgi:hypothetical protein
MLPAGDADSNADSDLVASLLLQHRRKQQHKHTVRALMLDAPCSVLPATQQPSATDFEKQVRSSTSTRLSSHLQTQPNPSSILSLNPPPSPCSSQTSARARVR